MPNSRVRLPDVTLQMSRETLRRPLDISNACNVWQRWPEVKSHNVISLVFSVCKINSRAGEHYRKTFSTIETFHILE